MFRNPITPQLLGHFREGSSAHHVLTILFDKYWDEISDFARENHLAMPTHYLGMGETGIALRAGRRVIKILTLRFNNQSPEDDLQMLKYLSQYRLPGFARVDAVLPLKVRYWTSEFLADLKQRKSGARWKRRIARMAREKDPTWIIWLEKLDHPEKAISAIAKYHRRRRSAVERQFELLQQYTKVAMDALGIDTSYIHHGADDEGWESLERVGTGDRYDLTNIGQEMSWEDYNTAKEQIAEYLNEIYETAPLFQDLIGSLQTLLDEDIIVGDMKEDNMGIRWVGDEPVPTLFDAIFFFLNP